MVRRILAALDKAILTRAGVRANKEG